MTDLPPPAAPVTSMADTSGFAPRMWTLLIPAVADFYTSNIRANHHERAKIVKAWRDATYLIATQQRPKLPIGLRRVRMDAQLRFNNNNRRDLVNYADAAKPVVDALGPPFIRTGKKQAAALGYELIPDDGPKHLDGPYVTFGERVAHHERRMLVLTITDLSDLPDGRTWTPELVTATGKRRIVAKRQCNGCGRRIGDVTDDEVLAVFSGQPLPDVAGECPACSTLLAVPRG